MNALLKLSFKDTYGNLIWGRKYVYPETDLKQGIAELQKKGYWISSFPEGDGFAFRMESDKSESFSDFEIAFPWMNMKCYSENEEMDYDNDLFNEQIVILPLTRLNIDNPIYSRNLCIFPSGQFPIELLNAQIPDKFDFNKLPKEGCNRNLVTSVTQIDEEAFKHNALVVFRDSITIEEYAKMLQPDDVELIKKYSERAESVLDIIRFFECNYTTPELLPAKAGVWDDRYSAFLLYFPKFDIGVVQSREVEIKTFIKGIGVDISDTMQITYLPIFMYQDSEIGEVGRLCKYALKLNTTIAESDNQSVKFMQIMTLLEFLGSPHEYKQFQMIKGKIISYVATDKKHYHSLSEKFKYYSKDLRTEIVHNGKRIEDLLTAKEIFGLFQFFHRTIFTIILDMITNFDMDWFDYQNNRKIEQDKLTS